MAPWRDAGQPQGQRRDRLLLQQSASAPQLADSGRRLALKQPPVLGSPLAGVADEHAGQICINDVKALEVAARKRARQVLRSLAYPASDQNAASRAAAAAVEARPLHAAAKKSPNRSPRGATKDSFELALTAEGPEALQARRQAVESRLPFAEDFATLMVRETNASLDRVDVHGLGANLDGNSAPALHRNGTGMRSSRENSAAVLLGSSSRLQSPVLAAALQGLAAEPSAAYELDVDAAVRTGTPSACRHWPDLEEFEQHYHLPVEVAPRKSRSLYAHAGKELPPPRETISSLDEVGPEALAQQTATSWSTGGGANTLDSYHHPVPQQRAGIFEALNVYRDACKQLGVPELRQVPMFSEVVEVGGGVSISDTRQCFAIAAAVNACKPREVVLENCFLTDVGAARIVEIAIACGRLTKLRISGSCLSYRTCAALNALGSRKGAKFIELSLPQCGLGGDLPEDFLRELHGMASSVYNRSLSALQHGGKVCDRSVPVCLPLLAYLVRPGCTLRRLDLSRSALSVTMVCCLARGSASAPLEVLHLNRCSMEDESVAALAACLVGNKHLLELGLRRSMLQATPATMSALLDAAGRHARLAHLDLSENPVPTDCINDLCALLRWSCSLLGLHLLGKSSQASSCHVVAACRRWIAQRDAELQGNDVESLIGERGAEDVEDAEPDDEAEELVLCRALHVEGLAAWRIVSPGAMQKEALAAKKMPSQCWICQRCATVKYRWIVPDRGEGSESGASGVRVFVRTSFTDFAPVELRRQRIVGARRVQYATHLIVPPGQHCHVFEAVIGTRHVLLSASNEETAEPSQLKFLTESQRQGLQRLSRQNRYNGPVNVLPSIMAEAFQIPEHVPETPRESVEADPWAEDPVRCELLQKCFDADVPQLHLGELCRADEEAEVLATLQELYRHLYETYVIYAGQSQWPLIRHMDVYSFFDDAQLIDRIHGPGPAASPGAGAALGAVAKVHARDAILVDKEPFLSSLDASLSPSSSPPRALLLQDVKQMLTQTSATRGDGFRQAKAADSGAKAGPRAIEVAAPINRSQFLEVLLRAAVALYADQPSTPFAIRSFVQDILVGRIFQPPLSQFPRGMQCQPGEVQDKLLAGRQTLLQAWERFGTSEVAFQRLMQVLKICDRSFTAKHVSAIYALSRRPEPEIGRVARKALRYDEFCEAAVRVSLTWQPVSRADRAPVTGSNSRTWPPQPQVGRPVKQETVAATLEAFLAKMAECMRPTTMPNPSLW